MRHTNTVLLSDLCLIDSHSIKFIAVIRVRRVFKLLFVWYMAISAFRFGLARCVSIKYAHLLSQ